MSKIRLVGILLTMAAMVFGSARLHAASADRVSLVKDGMPVATIVVGEKLAAAEQYAAQELQEYLKKISGAQLPIGQHGEAIQGGRILLGTFESNASINALRDKLKTVDTLGQEGFVIKTIGGDLVIVGGGSSGTLYGVYTFLEKYLGCRWFFPGEDGEVIPKRESIQLGSLHDIEQPSLEYRGTFIFDVPNNHQYDQKIVDWMARNKMNSKMTHHHVIGIGIEPSDPTITTTQYEGMRSRAVTPDTSVHSFWWLVPADEYYDKHPEYFPLINGKRARPDNPGSVHVQLCLSNSEVLAIVVKKSRAFFAKYPEVKTMGVGPNDGEGWCDCDNCRAMGKTRTDQLVTFVNRAAKEIRKTHPNNYIGFLAYSDCTEPPTMKPADNVMVEYVRNGRCYKHALNDPRCETNAIRAREIKGWLEKVKPSHLTWGDFTDPWNDLPQPTAGVMAEDLKWFSALGMAGLTTDVTPASWGMLKLYNYVAAKVSWDASLKYEDILDDFCRNYYGPAAEPMKEYYQALDRAVQTSPGCFRRGNIANVASILSPELLRELKGYLQEAETLARGNKDVYARLAGERRHYTKYVKATLGRADVDEEGGKNLVSNPGFEAGRRNWLATVQRGKYDLSIDEAESLSGQSSAKIACAEPGRAMWRQVIPVEKGEKYHFTVWVRAERKPPGTTILWLHQGPTHRTGKLVYLDAEVEGQWQKYIVPEITTIQDTLTIFLMGDGPGTIRFDDAALRKINAGTKGMAAERAPTEYGERVASESASLEKWATILDKVRQAQRASAAREARVLPVNGSLPADAGPAEWEHGTSVANFVEKIRQVLAREQSRCWLRYDRENLYAIFKCQEPSLDKLRYCKIERDGPVWDADDVEVFIDANNDKNTYYLFGTDAAGSRFDMSCSKEPYKQDISWSIPWSVRTLKGRACWYAEMAIPLAKIGVQPTKGTYFGISLNRTRYAGSPGIASAWPNGKFHQPRHFGTAVFE